MPRYKLQYLARSTVSETIEADDPDAAEDLARMRLLFSEPGFSIAIMADGHELRRITQQPLIPVRS